MYIFTHNFNRALWTGIITSKSLKGLAFSLILYTSDMHNTNTDAYDVLITTNAAGK